VTNGDCVIAYQDVFYNEPYDSLALSDTERINSSPQAGEERGKGLCQSQEDGPIVGLVGDCLQLSTNGLFTLAQSRHALAQLLNRHQCFLVGAEKPFDALVNMG
jgi:hypothetical protein